MSWRQFVYGVFCFIILYTTIYFYSVHLFTCFLSLCFNLTNLGMEGGREGGRREGGREGGREGVI